MRRRSPRNSPRGFMLLDTVGGLLLLLVTILLLSTVTSRGRIAARKLAADRAATRLAEIALLRGANDLNPAATEGVEIKRLDAPAPPDFVWATATAIIDGRHVELTGLIRSPAGSTEVAP